MTTLRITFALACLLAIACSSRDRPLDGGRLDGGSVADGGRSDATVRVDATVGDDSAVPDAAPPADAPSEDGAIQVDGAPCTRPGVDPSGAGLMCEEPFGTPDPSACPTGYECTPFSGVRLGYTCERRCTSDCDCPMDTTCGDRCDKSGCIRACQAS